MTNRAYVTLDGLRGVAALCVLVRHWDTLLGFELPSSHLAVDLFFVLSGFVISHAYEHRFVCGLSPARFIWLRICRFYPLYLLGTIFGLAFAVGAALVVEAPGAWTLSLAASSLPFALLFLPSLGPAFSSALYPFNPAAWSLMFELIANAFYAVTWRRMTVPVLMVVVSASGVALVITGMAFGTLDVGNQAANVVGGLSRVLFGFSLGVLMYRLRRFAPKLRIAPAFLFAVLPIMFSVNLGVAYELSEAILLCPLIVWCGIDLPPGRTAGFCAWAGTLSYGAYIMHDPFERLLSASTRRLGWDLGLSAPWSGLAALLAFIGLCWLADRYLDAPIRKRFARVPERLKLAA